MDYLRVEVVVAGRIGTQRGKNADHRNESLLKRRIGSLNE
jgi:hypothetical protein